MINTGTSEHGLFKVQFEAEWVGNRFGYYVREDFVLRLSLTYSIQAGDTWYKIDGVKYWADADNTLVINLADYLRTFGVGADKTLTIEHADPREEDAVDRLEINITLLFGIAPSRYIIPFPDYYYNRADYIYNLPCVVMPSVVYTHDVLSRAYKLQFILQNDKYRLGVQFSGVMKDWGLQATAEYNNGVLLLPNLDLYDETNYMIDLQATVMGTPEKRVTFRQLGECDNAVVLRWASDIVGYKQLIWRVKDFKRESNVLDLLPIGDNYKPLRGQVVSFVAYLEGLTAYDYAYYADIITSSDVHAALAEDVDLTAESSRVQIETAEYTIPNGDAGELYTLAVTIRYKHYDTI